MLPEVRQMLGPPSKSHIKAGLPNETGLNARPDVLSHRADDRAAEFKKRAKKSKNEIKGFYFKENQLTRVLYLLFTDKVVDGVVLCDLLALRFN